MASPKQLMDIHTVNLRAPMVCNDISSHCSAVVVTVQSVCTTGIVGSFGAQWTVVGQLLSSSGLCWANVGEIVATVVLRRLSAERLPGDVMRYM